jgi:MFS transporter, DHA2 family, multidrug resistance protein
MSNETALKFETAAAQPSALMTPSQTTRVLMGLGLATSMEFYTYDAVNLILPEIAGSFGVSQDEASWLLTTYSSALFLGVPISIWLAGHIGHLRYILGSAIIFVIASIGCALAVDFDTMLFWRVVLGFSGAGLTMWWRASVYLLTPRAERSKSLMRISVMLYLATATGLLFSGYATDNFSWRLIFLPNVIFVAGAIWLLRRHFPAVPASHDPRIAGVDRLGLALLAAALISGQVILSRGEIDDWFNSPLIQALAWLAAAALLLFVGWQLSSRNKVPLFRLELVADRNVVASIFLGVFVGVIFGGAIYALPEFLREVQTLQLNAFDTGRIMCVYALTAAAIRPFVTWSIGKFGQRKVLIFALGMLVISMLMMSRLVTADTPPSYFVFPLVLYAFCLAPLLSSVAGGTVARLPQQAQLDAVTIYMTCRQFGSSLGVTLVTILLDRREELHSSRLFEHLQATGVAVGPWLSSAAQIAMQRAGVTSAHAQDIALGLLAQVASRQAATLAYADAFLFMAAVGLAALCFVPLMAKPPAAKK